MRMKPKDYNDLLQHLENAKAELVSAQENDTLYKTRSSYIVLQEAKREHAYWQALVDNYPHY